MSPWSFAFDSASLRAIQRLAGFEAFLAPELEGGMHTIVTNLTGYAQAYMWNTFMNPTGPLEDSVTPDVPNPWTGTVYTDSPYGWRREEGFSGKTDSLGRFYPQDPGIAFFATTLADNLAPIRATLEAAVGRALLAMGGP